MEPVLTAAAAWLDMVGVGPWSRGSALVYPVANTLHLLGLVASAHRCEHLAQALLEACGRDGIVLADACIYRTAKEGFRTCRILGQQI